MSSHDSSHADPDSGYETDLRTALITGRSKLLGRRKRQFRWGTAIGVATIAVTAFGWTRADRATTLVADGQQVTTSAPLPPPLEPTITRLLSSRRPQERGPHYHHPRWS